MREEYMDYYQKKKAYDEALRRRVPFKIMPKNPDARQFVMPVVSEIVKEKKVERDIFIENLEPEKKKKA